MTDASLSRTRLIRRLHRPHPLRSLLAGVSSVARSTGQRLPDLEHLALLARRLAPVTVTLLLAQGFFLAGFFYEPILNLPLGVLTVGALVGITARDYRADIRNHGTFDDLRRRNLQLAEESRRREVELLDDIGRLGAGAVEAATPLAILNSRLGAMGPLLVDLLATPSAARQEQLAQQLERAAVGGCAELIGHRGGGGRAVLYRRVGGRFEPQWPEGAWPTPPLRASRTSEQAREMNLVLRQRRVVHAAAPDDRDRPQVSVGIPLHAGRRGIGVLLAQRPGTRRVEGEDLETMLVMTHVLAAASAGVDGPGRRRARVSARARARWARRHAGAVTRARSAHLVRGDLASKLGALVRDPKSRQALSAATRAATPTGTSPPSAW